MNVLHMTKWCIATAWLAGVAVIGLNQRVDAQQPQPPRQPQEQALPAGQDGMEVLTRGPLHEAFAETIAFDPEPGMVAPEAPPADIEEVPPPQRPAGTNLAWIPGYWAWDDERNDFLWVSGIWRALPPGRQWVPGYWAESPQGFQWTSGYWADAAASEIDYLPEPPATVEAGPNIAAPSADDIWLPGCWIWQQNRYVWRPGYWTTGHQDWDWVPAHYVWTRRGYIFVDGYYDYSVSRRGVVFAPVYFNQGLRSQRGFSYSPSTVINAAVFASHLFLRPGYGHYYFGDYYGPNYSNAGFSPWFSFYSSRRGYDPIYANQRWQNRRDRDWERRTEAAFQSFSDNEDARPPRTLAAQRELAQRADLADRTSSVVAAPLEELAKRKDAPLRFQPVDPTERQQFGQRGQAYRAYLQQRQKVEADAASTPAVEPATPAGPARRKLSRSPIVAPPADQLGKDFTPPQRHQAPKPDVQVQPQPRSRGKASPQRQPVNQGNRQGAATSIRQSQGPPASRGQAQGTAKEKSQAAPKSQPRGEPKKKDKD